MKPSSSGEGGIESIGGVEEVEWVKWVFALANRCYRNPIFLGQEGASFLFEEDGFAGLEGEDGNAGSSTGFQRLGTEAGDIETQVVFFPGDLDSDCAAVLAGQAAAAGQALICAIKCFDCQNGAVFDDNSLADFEP